MILHINGKSHEVDTDTEPSLLSVLRNEMDLTGTKYGCGEGACGACMVLVEGKLTRSCTTPASKATGKQITTIEGLGSNGKLHKVQEAYLEADPFQCAYCAPGMIIATVALLEQHPTPTEEQIVSFMNGNICRCGTYPKIIEAIQLAAKK